MNFRDSIVSELARLKLMDSRVPYTYYYDYVRLNADEAKLMSCADIAQFNASEDQLYACAFLQAVEGLSTRQKIITKISKSLYYLCMDIALSHIMAIDQQIKTGASYETVYLNSGY